MKNTSISSNFQVHKIANFWRSQSFPAKLYRLNFRFSQGHRTSHEVINFSSSAPALTRTMTTSEGRTVSPNVNFWRSQSFFKASPLCLPLNLFKWRGNRNYQVRRGEVMSFNRVFLWHSMSEGAIKLLSPLSLSLSSLSVW